MTLSELILKDITNQGLCIDEAQFATSNTQYLSKVTEALLSCGIDNIENSINHNFNIRDTDDDFTTYKVQNTDVKAKQQKLLKEI